MWPILEKSNDDFAMQMPSIIALRPIETCKKKQKQKKKQNEMKNLHTHTQRDIFTTAVGYCARVISMCNVFCMMDLMKMNLV